MSTTATGEAVRYAMATACATAHRLLVVVPRGSSAIVGARRVWELLGDFEDGSPELVESSWMMLGSGLWRGLDRPGDELSVKRPFRAPHHSVSSAGLIGGGHSVAAERDARGRAVSRRWNFRPGEVSLAHGGVLLLDEADEFHAVALGAALYALDDGQCEMVRTSDAVTFPARPARVIAVVYSDQQPGSPALFPAASPHHDRKTGTVALFLRHGFAVLTVSASGVATFVDSTKQPAAASAGGAR